jgi:hypothetical protein
MAELIDFAAQLLAHFTDHLVDRTLKNIRPRAGRLRAGVDRTHPRYHRFGNWGMRSEVTRCSSAGCAYLSG